MDELKINRGRLGSPSSHPLRELVIKLFDGVTQEDLRKKITTKESNEKPSWNSLLSKLKKTLPS